MKFPARVLSSSALWSMVSLLLLVWLVTVSFSTFGTSKSLVTSEVNFLLIWSQFSSYAFNGKGLIIVSFWLPLSYRYNNLFIAQVSVCEDLQQLSDSKFEFVRLPDADKSDYARCKCIVWWASNGNNWSKGNREGK